MDECIVDVDILIISSSRPDVLYYCLKSFDEKLINCRKRYFINEDVVNTHKSSEIEQVLDRLGLCASIHRNDQPCGPFKAILNFSLHCTSPYIFIIEDDWELEDDIMVDRLFLLMNKYKNINEIILRYKDKEANGGLIISDFDYNLVLYTTPLASPGLWRAERLRKSLKDKQVHDLIFNTPFQQLRIPTVFPNYYKNINKIPKGPDQINWLTNHIGAYAIKTPHNQVRHLGGTWKTFIPLDTKAMLIQELNAWYFIHRTPLIPPDARPINGKIPYDQTFMDDQIKKAGKRLADYLYFIKSLHMQLSLDIDQWKDFLVKYNLIDT